MTIETKAERTTLADILASGYLHGYEPGAPPNAANGENLHIDQGVCRDATCDHCGTKGLRYRPYHAPGSYIAFAVCPACFHAVEF